jgi:hypothetical protein
MINDARVDTKEKETTFKSESLRDTLREIDERVSHLLHPVITRTVDKLVERIDYYQDETLTKLVFKRDFVRFVGTGGIKLIGGIVTTFYNDNGSIDSVNTLNLTRNPTGENFITSCDSIKTSPEV